MRISSSKLTLENATEIWTEGTISRLALTTLLTAIWLDLTTMVSDLKSVCSKLTAMWSELTKICLEFTASSMF